MSNRARLAARLVMRIMRGLCVSPSVSSGIAQQGVTAPLQLQRLFLMRIRICQSLPIPGLSDALDEVEE